MVLERVANPLTVLRFLGSNPRYSVLSHHRHLWRMA
uniref:Uncharacterized protein n=1 Tax=Siphoviridae sp. ctr2f5 TaxID=2825684 RepID=A0A8S5QFQ2_9CAUD|nr:MAG TPA: hypothetical protein [Siphoviridae sp. ctr2f5]